VASLTDITKRKKVAVAHRESKRRYRELVENINDVIYTVNTEGVITYISPRVNELIGYESSEIIGKDFSKFVYEEDIPLLEKYYISIIRSGQSKSIEYRVQKRSGRIRWVRSSSRPNRLKDNVVSIQGVIADISELRTAEKEKNHMHKQLHKAQKMEAIGTLAGGVAHDLNNILSGLVSYPELLLMKLPENSSMRKPIQTIQRSGEKAATIVQDLLTLARRGVTVTEAVDLNHIVREFFVSPEYEKIKYYFPEMQVELTLDNNILPIIGSPVHLSKTVMNLVSNAAEAMSQGGKLHVTTQNEYIDFPISSYDDIDEGNYVLLTVTDNGIGIPVKDLDRIFEPFYTKKVMGRSGTGLGMAVVWGTIKDHNGYIDVQSKEGEGTTFKLYFPASSREIVTTKDKVAIEALRGNGESILVVDDVEEQREIATGLMTLLGYRVVALSSGEEAVAYLRNHSVDLLILDMIMDPGIDGLETYKQILGLHPGQKAVIASGFSETDRVKETQHLGAGVYVKKPYRLETIGLAVKQVLETKAAV
jgi:two-component system cell cycle sensor histidine kinase/response regulator CckA